MNTLFEMNRCFLQIQIRIGGALFYIVHVSLNFFKNLFPEIWLRQKVLGSYSTQNAKISK